MINLNEGQNQQLDEGRFCSVILANYEQVFKCRNALVFASS